MNAGSLTISLTLNEDGTANLYEKNVGDRDTWSFFDHTGGWTQEGDVITVNKKTVTRERVRALRAPSFI
jgi:hypothetical protein